MLRRSGLWVPVLVVGAALYWTVALGLGGLSLAIIVAPEEMALVPETRASMTIDEPIAVRLVSADDVPESDGEPTETVPGIRVRLMEESFLPNCMAPERPEDDLPGRTAY